MEYVLYKIGGRPSQRTQGYTYTLRFLHAELLTDLVMYVDTAYGNYRHWRQICEHSELGIYTGIQLTDRTSQGRPVLNADSEPRLVCAITAEQAQEIAQALRALAN